MIVKHENQAGANRTLRLLISVGSSLTAGFAVASLEALRPNFSFEISWKTVVAFFIGAILLYCYWKVIFRQSNSSSGKRLRWAASLVLAALGVLGFLYPLRFIAPNNYKEVTSGLLMAFGAILAVVTLLWLCKRFLDEDTRWNK